MSARGALQRWPAAIPATDALRAQVMRAAVVCEIGLDEAADAVGMSEAGVRVWLTRWFGTGVWPADADSLEQLIAVPIEIPGSTLGPVGRLAQVAEALTRQLPGSIAGKGRAGPAVRARQAVCWAIRRHYGETWSYPMIGRALGGRDHSTVIHAVRQAEIRRERDSDFAALCDILLVHAASTVPLLPGAGRALPDWAIDPQGWLKSRDDAETVVADSGLAEAEVRSGEWCDQCDALVGAERKARCRDRWCSLKARA